MRFPIYSALAVSLGATPVTAATFSSTLFAQVSVRTATFVDTGEDALSALTFDWFNDDVFQNGTAYASPNVDRDIAYYPDFFPYPNFAGAITTSSLIGRETKEYDEGGEYSFGFTDGLHEWAVAALDYSASVNLVIDYSMLLSASSTEDNTSESGVDGEVRMTFSGGGDVNNGFVARQGDYSQYYFDEVLEVGFAPGEEGSEVLQKTGTWTYTLAPGEFIGVNTYFDTFGWMSPIPAPTPVPLPASFSLLGFGIAGLLLFSRRKSHRFPRSVIS